MGDKLKVACYGSNGHQIVHKLADHPRARLVAASEISAEHLEQHLGDAACEVRREPDLEGLIAARDVELISLCSPRRSEQAQQAIACLRGGKHVLAEKPAAMSIPQLEQLHQAMGRCESEFRQMGACDHEALLGAVRRVVEAGRIGQVVQLYVLKSYPYHDRRPQDRGIDGGLIRQAGIHGVRFVQLATGLRAIRVCGLDTGRGNPAEGELQMGASVALQLESGAVAALLCNYCNPSGIGFWGNDQLRIHGTKGMIEAVDGMRRCRMVIGETAAQPIPEVPDSYPDFFDSYVDFLLDGTPMPYSCDEDLYALRTVIRAQDAVDAGAILDV